MKYLKDKFKALDPYIVGEVKEGIYLNANEAFYDIPKKIKDYAANYVLNSNLNRYPDTDCKKLAKAVAKKYNVKEENVICTVGSDELIDLLVRSTAEEKKVLAVEPTFSMYKIFSFMSDGDYEAVPLNDDFTYNVDRIIKKINEINPIITFICNPNNPSGSAMKKEDIIKILNVSKGIVVVDEAYEDFANVSVIDLVSKYDNLCVLRTFSKAYALAGIRCGYAITDPEIVRMINTVKPPYTLNSFSLEVGAYALDNSYLYKELVDEVIASREYLYKELKAMNIEVYPSKANFLYLYLTEEQKNKLEANKIFIRYFKKYSRVTVGSKEENEAFLNALRG